MIKKLLIIATLLLPLSLSAQIFYKVSGDNLKTDSYILGSHHLTSFSFTEGIAGFSEAFASCDKVYGEIKSDAESTAQLTQNMMSRMMLPADTLFTDLVSPEEYSYIDSQIKRYLGATFSLDQLTQLNPAAISMQLGSMVALMDDNGNMRELVEPMDATIQAKAVALGKEVSGLESVESQLDLLFSGSLEEQADDLIVSLKSGDLRKETKLQTAFYEAHDSEGLFVHIEKSVNTSAQSESEAAETMEKILFGRNRAWAEIMPAIMQESPTLFVVGAGHLHGSEGIIPLLESRGFTVTPIN